ncbi:hypothetical protein K5E40_11985 [Pseudomonas baetica]|uniref:hypothetical protein n=1 Tax=Pseudomonas baetica TaxID=674054 RepID=UPI001C8BB2A8|nr:hypothetical protein [Pseudomonas baetica]MBX9406397.1 hypothetical protein [Pseudomonas baetica]
MNLDIPLDQVTWLNTNVIDLQSLGGVCHAMSTEWVLTTLQNQPWDIETAYLRGVSHQRAYALRWEYALRGNWGGAQYAQYLQIAASPTQRFIEDPARRQGRPFHAHHVHSLIQMAPHLALAAGSGAVIVMFGSDANQPATAQNWGHTVAMVRTGAGIYQFLDVNEGRYSWQAGATNAVVAQEVRQKLRDCYWGWGIRDIYIFKVG